MLGGLRLFDAAFTDLGLEFLLGAAPAVVPFPFVGEAVEMAEGKREDFVVVVGAASDVLDLLGDPSCADLPGQVQFGEEPEGFTRCGRERYGQFDTGLGQGRGQQVAHCIGVAPVQARQLPQRWAVVAVCEPLRGPPGDALGGCGAEYEPGCDGARCSFSPQMTHILTYLTHRRS